MELNGAQVVLECLKNQGVDTIFGYPGGAVIPLYDALYDQGQYFTHIRTAHEQGAVHGADGYARATGKVGVCFATSGPGATNTVTGIATAYMDSIPLVIITGQVPTNILGRDSFQEIDITGITVPITKHNFLVNDINELQSVVNEAFYIAREGRPGPVLIDIPKDVFLKRTDFHSVILNKKERYLNHNNEEEKLIKKAAKIINQSKRPIVYGGGGIITSEASECLAKLVDKSSIPVVNTLMGLGGFDRNKSLSLGLVGMHGFKEANLAVTNSDLIIALGARFSDRVVGKVDKFAPGAKIIHIDIDVTEVGKNKDVEVSLIGDLKEIINRLITHVEEKNRTDWIDRINSWKEHDKITERAFHPKNILRQAKKVLGEDALVITDVGQHQMWSAQYWNFEKPRTFISSGGLGTMGFGLGAAIGAKIGKPNVPVVHISGDGSFRMNCNELATISKYNVPITTILFNNSTLGMVRQWQRLFQNERYSETDIGNEVDYVKLVQAYGLKGYKVRNILELKEVLKEVKDANEFILIECVIDKDQGVYPIVPPGKPIDNLILD
ncbi:biosynthetic-type acetolactate synthase large subunit [Clostridiisalibacter paucivorans]|uniref:biosynthetic-type acetolactate synthase large subunit n=1 Tax=Clostridiisalibacter paucivorans TaxID=408753 RepID=UPI0004791362|nr:biosynthetic-type acetolactate synthase large subunit [Clostridiisalibacter paucivorans]